MTCDCMTETDPLDPDGPEVVLIHSSLCPEHPDYDDGGRWPDYEPSPEPYGEEL